MAISKKKRLTIFFGSFIVTSILMVSIFWEGKWLPENQVKRNILDNPNQHLQVTEHSLCQMECLDLSIGDIQYFIRNGEVDLPPLEREPCLKYLITYSDEKSGSEYEIIVKLCKEYHKDSRDGEMGTRVEEPSFLESVVKLSSDCTCE